MMTTLETCELAANPPFNVDKVKWQAAVDAGRLRLGTPKENKKGEISARGANYLWINYFYSYLNDTGRAGFVMASSATDSNAERAQRQTLVQSGHVDAMLYVGNNFFYTKSLPCTLWFFDKGKPAHLLDKVLFIDAQRYHTEVSTTLNEWSAFQLKNLSAIVWLYRGDVEKYAALLAEYRARAGQLAGLFEGVAGAEGAQGAAVRKVGASGEGAAAAEGFAAAHEAMLKAIEAQKAAAKAEVEALPKREQKKRREALAAITTNLEAAAKDVSEAVWLIEKFGAGEYSDVPGLCKVATRAEIQGSVAADKSSWSLTPGAYVGVPPVEDDGVNFTDRMRDIQTELLELQAQSNALMSTITQNFKDLGL